MTDPTILSGALQTGLDGATFVRAGWSRSRAAKMLAAGQFDQAPVLSGTRLVGYALRDDLEANPTRRVRGVTRSLDQEIVLSGAAQLSALLATLRDRRFAFIAGDNGISGFVTPSDLNKHAARAHFYLLIAALEIKLSDYIRATGLPQKRVLHYLNPASQKLIAKRFREDAAAEIEVDYLVYMQFSQLLNIVGREPRLFARLGFDSRSSWGRGTTGLVRLRNDVMHPTREFYGPSRSVSELIDAEQRLFDLLQRVDSAEATQRIAELETVEPQGKEVDAHAGRALTLHAAMGVLLLESGEPMKTRDLAAAVNARGLYRRGDGANVPSSQISARASKYPRLFIRTASRIGLRARD